jgi:hypothetical protein
VKRNAYKENCRNIDYNISNIAFGDRDRRCLFIDVLLVQVARMDKDCVRLYFFSGGSISLPKTVDENKAGSVILRFEQRIILSSICAPLPFLGRWVDPALRN